MFPVARSRVTLSRALLSLLPLLTLAVTHRLVAAPDMVTSAEFYAGLRPIFRPIPWQSTPAGLPDLRASTCGGCHVEIYREWKISTHARAWLDDPQFQAELRKHRGLSEDHPGDTGWLCVNCHTPLVNQLPQLVHELEEGRLDRPRYVANPRFDRVLRLEAITCATCHVRDGVILGPYGLDTAPHPSRKAPELLDSSRCVGCHNANAHLPEVALACLFNTGSEFAESPERKDEERCQTCHMPEVRRSLTALGTPVRRTRRHWFGGSLLAKRLEFAPQMVALQRHFKDGLELSWGELPDQLQVGQPTGLPIRLQNRHAGHHVPTGDPERFLVITATARDAEGAVVGTLEHRIGSVYQWSPVRKVSDNRLARGEQRELRLEVRPQRTGSITLELTARKFRIGREAYEFHHLEGRMVPSRVFHRSRRTLLAVSAVTAEEPR